MKLPPLRLLSTGIQPKRVPNVVKTFVGSVATATSQDIWIPAANKIIVITHLSIVHLTAGTLWKVYCNTTELFYPHSNVGQYIFPLCDGGFDTQTVNGVIKIDHNGAGTASIRITVIGYEY